MFGNKGAVEDIPDGITKIRIWRELLATCDKIEKKFEMNKISLPNSRRNPKSRL